MPSIQEIKIRDTTFSPEGAMIKVTGNTCSHGFKMGAILRVGRVIDAKAVHPYNLETGEPLNYSITIHDFVVLEEKKKRIFGDTYVDLDLSKLDKVELPKGAKLAIFETLVQESADNKRKLFEEWGFDEHFEKGKGIVFMFYGVPGTGKTMCAELMAKALKRDHLMLTTADIQSSVPGQAERNIQDAFKQAKSKNLLMIIDECDALIYNRDSVGAIMGAEINCLLSEIERFDGVVVMTTNRNYKLDPALERRIALKLEFPKPTKEIRRKIWRTLIPQKCPLAKCVSMEKLSEHEMCGGNIKNVIFAAARKALYEKKQKVRMVDFTRSIEREKDGIEAFETGDRRIPSIGECFDEGSKGKSDDGRITINRVIKAVTGGRSKKRVKKSGSKSAGR